MAIFEIIRDGDPLLRQQAKKVPKITANIHKLLDNMIDTMHEAEGVGLAAPQIGVSKRVIIVDIGEGLIELINPEVIESSGEQTDPEGCLSVPEVAGDVTRCDWVVVSGLNRDGEQFKVEGSGLLARVILHEMDHLDGVLFTDKINQPG